MNISVDSNYILELSKIVVVLAFTVMITTQIAHSHVAVHGIRMW